MKDWFGWIHPVAPIFHRNHFMGKLANYDAAAPDNQPGFLLLVASICAATVASLRKRRHLYTAITIDGCLDLAERLGMWSPSNHITLEWCLAAYNFSCAMHHERGLDSPLSHRLFSEAASSVKYLIYQENSTHTFLEKQQLKRLYWLIFAGQCTCDMHGRRLVTLHNAHDAVNGLMPMEVSDEQLMLGPTNISPSFSYIPGLNALTSLCKYACKTQNYGEMPRRSYYYLRQPIIPFQMPKDHTYYIPLARIALTELFL